MTASPRDSLPTAYVPPHWEGATRALGKRSKEPTFLVHTGTRKQGIGLLRPPPTSSPAASWHTRRPRRRRGGLQHGRPTTDAPPRTPHHHPSQ